MEGIIMYDQKNKVRKIAAKIDGSYTSYHTIASRAGVSSSDTKAILDALVKKHKIERSGSSYRAKASSRSSSYSGSSYGSSYGDNAGQLGINLSDGDLTIGIGGGLAIDLSDGDLTVGGGLGIDTGIDIGGGSDFF